MWDEGIRCHRGQFDPSNRLVKSCIRCAVQRNYLFSPHVRDWNLIGLEVHGISWNFMGGWGSVRPKHLKKYMKLFIGISEWWGVRYG